MTTMMATMMTMTIMLIVMGDDDSGGYNNSERCPSRRWPQNRGDILPTAAAR